MKKQLLAVAVASLVSVPVLADGDDLTGTGVLIWDGKVEHSCGWTTNESTIGKLGFGDWSSKPASVKFVNNGADSQDGDDDGSTLSYEATSSTFEEGDLDDLRIRLNGDNSKIEEGPEGTFENVQEGDLDFDAKMAFGEFQYPAGDHIVTAIVTIECEGD